jgi:hypothetical protein
VLRSPGIKGLVASGGAGSGWALSAITAITAVEAVGLPTSRVAMTG